MMLYGKLDTFTNLLHVDTKYLMVDLALIEYLFISVIHSSHNTEYRDC